MMSCSNPSVVISATMPAAGRGVVRATASPVLRARAVRSAFRGGATTCARGDPEFSFDVLNLRVDHSSGIRTL